MPFLDWHGWAPTGGDWKQVIKGAITEVRSGKGNKGLQSPESGWSTGKFLINPGSARLDCWVPGKLK
jgi:hypothetical protein